MGETGVRSYNAVLLAEALYEQGRDDEAEQYVTVSREIAAAEDSSSQVGWRTVGARLLARRGELDKAEQTAREAVELVGAQEAIDAPAAWSSLGETLARADKPKEAEQAFAEAIRLHEHKGNTAGAARTRDLSKRAGLQMR
jgi:tetratricopeptide (TPR) repeat protein